MAGFRKAKAEQAALKIGMYGPPGSGKTFTSLLIAEGLAKLTGKRVAFVDTEHGSDFYCKAVPSRRVHPAAFDFDALYTKSVTEAASSIKALAEDQYEVVVIDSITHLWTGCIAAYSGKLTKIGTIPITAWGRIKKPYKDLIDHLLSSKMHVLFLGRQGNVMETDEETDEMKVVGVKMKAEGETPYEPHILIRMEAVRPQKTNEIADVIAYAEKDRTGVLSGRSFVNPTFETLIKPLLPLLGNEQAQIATTDETAAKDAEALAEQNMARAKESDSLFKDFEARVTLCKTVEELKSIGGELTPRTKSKIGPDYVATLREKYLQRERELTGNLV